MDIGPSSTSALFQRESWSEFVLEVIVRYDRIEHCHERDKGRAGDSFEKELIGIHGG